MPAVVTYCRVSSEEQAQRDISIPAQRKALRHWVDERPDHHLAAEFVDEGESAYAPADKRPGFCDRIAHCRKHRVDLILVHKLDRFSRNREESILVKSLLRKHGVRVKSITEDYDPEPPQGFLYRELFEKRQQLAASRTFPVGRGDLAELPASGMDEESVRELHGPALVDEARSHSWRVAAPGQEIARPVGAAGEELGLGGSGHRIAGSEWNIQSRSTDGRCWSVCARAPGSGSLRLLHPRSTGLRKGWR